MNHAHNTSLHADAETVRLLAAANGLELTQERAAELVPFVQDILEASEALAALELDTLPAAGLPWAPFGTMESKDDVYGE